MLRHYIEKVTGRKSLSFDEMAEAMGIIMDGQATEIQSAGFLIGLKAKVESVEEITAAAFVMREKALRVETDAPILMDTCGTGGDGKGTFNISTAVAFIVASAGIPVAKHGNRSVSSRCGSADVLEALDIPIFSSSEQVKASIESVGFGFCFAPHFHQATKNVARPRKELGVRTIFNILGPLTNPAGANYQLLGVYDPNLVLPIAEALKNLGTKGAIVVHGSGGVDEFSLCGPNKAAILRDGKVKELIVAPEDAGLARASLEDVAGYSPEDNARILAAVLSGERGPKRDVVVFNAAAAFVATDMAKTFKEGAHLAEDLIDSGKAMDKLLQLKAFAHSLVEVAQC